MAAPHQPREGATNRLAVAVLEKADALLDGGAVDAALAECTAARALSPDLAEQHAGVLMARGHQLQRGRDHPKAWACYTCAAAAAGPTSLGAELESMAESLRRRLIDAPLPPVAAAASPTRYLAYAIAAAAVMLAIAAGFTYRSNGAAPNSTGVPPLALAGVWEVNERLSARTPRGVIACRSAGTWTLLQSDPYHVRGRVESRDQCPSIGIDMRDADDVTGTVDQANAVRFQIRHCRYAGSLLSGASPRGDVGGIVVSMRGSLTCDSPSIVGTWEALSR